MAINNLFLKILPLLWLLEEPTSQIFAFLPLESDSRRPLASGVPPPDGDCSYGMYHMVKTGTAGEFAYWMDGSLAFPGAFFPHRWDPIVEKKQHV